MIEELIVKSDENVRRALNVIDQSSKGICFIVDDNGVLTGLLADGDVRRSFLAGADLETCVSDIMVTNFLALPVETDAKIINGHLDKKIRVIPLLDDDGRPVDYATLFRNHAIPSAEPSLGGNEFDYVAECINTNWISSQGRFVKQFETGFADYIGVPHGIAVSNGTVALHLALVALGVGPGDEVIVPDLTFAASAAAVIHAGATPVLVDINLTDWCLDPAAVENAITERTRAIMPVHLYGQIADMDAILKIAKRHGLLVVEDCAEALGSSYRGRNPGSFGDAGTFSFFGNKLLTTGEGGMIVFRDDAVAERARRLRDHGMNPQKRYWHDDVGYNYRLTNIQAAIGVAQLERIDSIVERKLGMAQMYHDALKDIPQLVLPSSRDGVVNTCWMYPVLLNEKEASISMDDFESRMKLRGIDTRRVFYPLHEMPPYQEFSGNREFPNTKRISSTGISLPSSINLTPTDVRYIADSIIQILEVRDLMQQSS